MYIFYKINLYVVTLLFEAFYEHFQIHFIAGFRAACASVFAGGQLKLMQTGPTAGRGWWRRRR